MRPVERWRGQVVVDACLVNKPMLTASTPALVCGADSPETAYRLRSRVPQGGIRGGSVV